MINRRELYIYSDTVLGYHTMISMVYLLSALLVVEW